MSLDNAHSTHNSDDAHSSSSGGGRDELLREMASKRQRRATPNGMLPAETSHDVSDLPTAKSDTTRARHSQRQDSAQAVLKRFGADPLRHLARVFVGKQPRDAVKDTLALELLPYCYPKLKSVEYKGDIGQVTVVIGSAHAHDAVIEHDPHDIVTSIDAEVSDDDASD